MSAIITHGAAHVVCRTAQRSECQAGPDAQRVASGSAKRYPEQPEQLDGIAAGIHA
jgi:hypothetical protein